MTHLADPPHEIDSIDLDTEQELTDALRAAWAPGTLSPEVNEVLIAAALEDPFAPPSEAELVASERLRDALATGHPHPDADLARALAAASHPASLDQDRGEALAQSAVVQARRRQDTVRYVAFGTAAAAVLALAASVAVVFVSQGLAPPAARPALVPARSTASLFEERFVMGRASARIDRIARARSRDLRQNRYATWGLP